jgi:hypothetical protein
VTEICSENRIDAIGVPRSKCHVIAHHSAAAAQHIVVARGIAGGGVANDEIREELTQREPDILLLFASSAKDAPFIRELIDGIRENGGYTDMQIVVGGGIFNRAPGLSEEIGADVCAASPSDLLEKLVTERTVRNDRFSAVAERHRRVA